MSLYSRLTELELCNSKADFSVFWLQKSDRYYSTLLSENGNASFEVVLIAKKRLCDFIEDESLYYPENRDEILSVYDWLTLEIDQLLERMITE